MKFKAQFLMLIPVIMMSGCSEPVNEKTVGGAEIHNKIPEYAMVIHGGAGTITRANMTAEKEKAYDNAMHGALNIGEEILSNGGTCLDAIQATIIYMENSPLFNAGKGAVFTHSKINELDASIMDGRTQNAGAISGVTNIKNPIIAARAVMEKSEHVFLSGKGAEQFAQEQGIEQADPTYFHTDRRWESLQKVLEKERAGKPLAQSEKHGTVGAVALDKFGNIAAGTSTGGMTNKKYNRIGDSPVIGAGTYANNATCGVSSTGHGEYFIRYAVAHDISAMMEYQNVSVKTAAEYVINDKLKSKGGEGGVIALDARGNVAMSFNTEGMYRGYVKPGVREVKIYRDE